MSNFSEMKRWQVHEFSWGTAIKTAHGRWESLYLRPDGQEINVEHLDVVLHDNGIEFIRQER